MLVFYPLKFNHYVSLHRHQSLIEVLDQQLFILMVWKCWTQLVKSLSLLIQCLSLKLSNALDFFSNRSSFECRENFLKICSLLHIIVKSKQNLCFYLFLPFTIIIWKRPFTYCQKKKLSKKDNCQPSILFG